MRRRGRGNVLAAWAPVAAGSGKMKITFLDSWPQGSAQGSGTAVGIGGLERALRALGHEVTRLAPPRPRPADLTLRRLLFNVRLPALLN